MLFVRVNALGKKEKKMKKEVIFDIYNLPMPFIFLETKHYQLMLLESIFKNIVLISYFKMDKRDFYLLQILLCLFIFSAKAVGKKLISLNCFVSLK